MTLFPLTPTKTNALQSTLGNAAIINFFSDFSVIYFMPLGFKHILSKTSLIFFGFNQEKSYPVNAQL